MESRLILAFVGFGVIIAFVVSEIYASHVRMKELDEMYKDK